MNQHRITPMTESGLLAALTVMLALAAVYLPVLGMAATLIWPLPVLVLVVRLLRWKLVFGRRRYRYGRSVGSGRTRSYRGRRRH